MKVDIKKINDSFFRIERDGILIGAITNISEGRWQVEMLGKISFIVSNYDQAFGFVRGVQETARVHNLYGSKKQVA